MFQARRRGPFLTAARASKPDRSDLALMSLNRSGACREVHAYPVGSISVKSMIKMTIRAVLASHFSWLSWERYWKYQECIDQAALSCIAAEAQTHFRRPARDATRVLLFAAGGDQRLRVSATEFAGGQLAPDLDPPLRTKPGAAASGLQFHPS